MFTAALFTIAKTQKQHKSPTTGEWVNKMWYTHTMECYSVIQRNEILSFAATWMDLESIRLIEISQTEKDKYCIMSLKCSIEKIMQLYVYANRSRFPNIEKQFMITKAEKEAGREKLGVLD